MTRRRAVEIGAAAIGLVVWTYAGWDSALWDPRWEFGLHLAAVAAVGVLVVVAWRGGLLPRTRLDRPILLLLAAFAVACLSAWNAGLSARALAAILGTTAMLPLALLVLRHRRPWTALLVVLPIIGLAAGGLVVLVGRRIEWIAAGAWPATGAAGGGGDAIRIGRGPAVHHHGGPAAGAPGAACPRAAHVDRRPADRGDPAHAALRLTIVVDRDGGGGRGARRSAGAPGPALLALVGPLAGAGAGGRRSTGGGAHLRRAAPHRRRVTHLPGLPLAGHAGRGRRPDLRHRPGEHAVGATGGRPSAQLPRRSAPLAQPAARHLRGRGARRGRRRAAALRHVRGGRGPVAHRHAGGAWGIRGADRLRGRHVLRGPDLPSQLQPARRAAGRGGAERRRSGALGTGARAGRLATGGRRGGRGAARADTDRRCRGDRLPDRRGSCVGR